MSDNQAQKMLTITLPDGEKRTVKSHIPVLEILKDIPLDDERYPVLGAKVSNKLHSLKYQLHRNCDVDFVTYRDREGVDIYRRTLCAILARAVTELRSNTRLVVLHSLGNAFYYDYYTDILVNESLLKEIEAKMREIIEKDEEIDRKVLPVQEAINFFREEGQTDKVRLLAHTELEKVAIYTCGKYTDIGHGPLAPSTGYTKKFNLKPYHNGFILMSTLR